MAETIKSIAAIISALGVILGLIWRLGTRVGKITEGQKCMLRKDITDTYYAGKETEKIQQYEYENTMLEYDAYKALGGNSFVDKLVAEIKTWEVVK